MVPKTQVLHLIHSLILQLPAKLPRKAMLMLENTAILKNGRHVKFLVSQNKISDSPYLKIDMI